MLNHGETRSYLGLKAHLARTEILGFSIFLLIYDRFSKANDVAGVKKVAELISQLRTEGKINLRDVAELRLKISDPEVSWLLHHHHLVDVVTQWRQCDEQYLETFVLDHWRTGSETAVNIVRAVLEAGETDKRMMMMMKRMLTLCCKRMNDDWRLEWLGSGYKRWSALALNHVIKHGAPASATDQRQCLEEAVRGQQGWSVSHVSGLGSLCHGLVTSFTAPDTVRIVSRVLERRDAVNWRHLLAVISVSCGDQVSAKLWSPVLAEMMRSALAEENTDLLVTSLLIKRQVVQVSGGNYSAWFSEVTSDDSGQGPQSRAECVFLMRVLLELAPLEPVSVLRSHVSVRPSVVMRHSRDQWEEYRHCARSRLVDHGNGVTGGIHTSAVTDKTLKTVEDYIRQWHAAPGKIPQSLSNEIMFSRPLYESQLLPGLVSIVLKTSELEVSREQLVTRLREERRISEAVFTRYKSGQYKPQFGAHVMVTDQDCSEENLTNMLEILVITAGDNDDDQLSKVCSQISVILQRLVQQSCVSVFNILHNTGGDDNIKTRVCDKILETVLDHGDKHDNILSLLTCSSSLIVTALRYLMTNTVPHKLDAAIAKMLINNKKDLVEINQKKSVSFLDILCSRHHVITNQNQLQVVEKLFTELLPETDIRRMFLVNRRMFSCNLEYLYNYDDCDISDLCSVLEMEMSIVQNSGGRRPFINSTLAMFDHLLRDLDSVDNVTKIVHHILNVWRELRRHNEFRDDDMVMLVEAFIQCFSSVSNTTWLNVFRNSDHKHEEIMIKIWTCIPGLKLSQEDVESLFNDVTGEDKRNDARSDTKLVLSCDATKLLMNAATERSSSQVSACLGYWYSRGRIPHHQCLDDDQWEGWRKGKLLCDDVVRVGVVILAEEYLERGSDVLLDQDNPTRKKLVKLMSLSSESSLATSPSDWWPGMMSEQLTNSSNIVILFIFTSIIKPSINFFISTIIPRLSQLMSHPDVQDSDVSFIIKNTIKTLKTFPRQQVTVILNSLKCSLNKDLKAILNSYV